jgi:hypothetical protein
MSGPPTGALPVEAVERWPRTAVLAAAATYAVVMGQLRSFTWESALGLAMAWVAVLWVGLDRDRPRLPAAPRPSWVGIGAWAVPILGFSALEIVNDLLGSTYQHPTLSVLMDPVLENPVNRTAAVAVWLLTGWELLRR